MYPHVHMYFFVLRLCLFDVYWVFVKMHAFRSTHKATFLQENLVISTHSASCKSNLDPGSTLVVFFLTGQLWC